MMKKVGSRFKNIPISRLEYINHTLFMNKNGQRSGALGRRRAATPPPPRGGTPLYGQYRYVPPQWVWFLSRFGQK